MNRTVPPEHEKLPGIAGLERDAWIDIIENGDRAAVAAARLQLTWIGPAAVVSSRPGGPLVNRTYGAPADPASLRAIREHYEAANVPLYFIEIDDADNGRAADAAERAGLVRYRRAMLGLVHAMGSVPPPATSLVVDIAREGELLRAAEIYCAAFDIDPVLAPAVASMARLPNWRITVARARGEVIATGLLFARGDAAYLMGGATAPSFRRMGAQSALIGLRVELARELGCRRVFARTGEPVPGDLQHSHRNMLRTGFVALGRRASYAPPNLVWTHGRRTIEAT